MVFSVLLVAATQSAAYAHDQALDVPYAAIIQRAAVKYELDPALVAAVIDTESKWDPEAVSSAGAQGLMQIMPETGRELGLEEPFDPTANINAGAEYLAGLVAYFGGDLDQAIMAYHGGPGRIRNGHARPIDRIYLDTVMAAYDRYRLAVASPTLPYKPGTDYHLVSNGYHGPHPHGRDYASACGTALYAPLTGWVDRTGTDSYQGPNGSNNTFIAFTDGRAEVLFMHGDYVLGAGDRVVQGETLIGHEASQGNSSQCHTHYSLWLDGQLVDPLALVGP
jgi:murein DD-endopeptidase MepM/ murein hydrolase activator NlpD